MIIPRDTVIMVLYRVERKYILVSAISSNRFFCLQCLLKECIPGDKTLHILSHFITKTEDELREILTRYMLSRLDRFKSVSRKFLQAEKISVEAYIDNLYTQGTPLDLLAVFVLARLSFPCQIFPKCRDVVYKCTQEYECVQACSHV